MPENQVVLTETNSEVVRCVNYLILRSQRKSVAECAIAMGYETGRRASMYDLIKRWRASGVYAFSESIVAESYKQEIKAAVDEVMRAWPDAIRRLLATATVGLSDRVAMEAFMVLNESIVKPKMNEESGFGAAETDYSKKIAPLNPMVIDMPKIRIAKLKADKED